MRRQEELQVFLYICVLAFLVCFYGVCADHHSLDQILTAFGSGISSG